MRELSLHVMDIAQNSISAEASLIQIGCEEHTAENRMVIRIEDNGRGLSPELIRQVTDPFYTTRTTRDVGLGIPLFAMAAEQTGGSLEIQSEVGEGTVVTVTFVSSHIDMVPLGDLSETVRLLITCNPHIDFVYTRSRDGREMRLDTRELREILGEDVPLSDPEVALWLRDYLAEQESALMPPAE